MKKITFICPNLKSGAGIERITSILINQFVASGCEVQLILLWENLVEFSLPDTVDVTFMGFDSSKKISYACRHIKELIKSIQGDIIYSLMNPASDIAILAGLLSRKKVIVAERNDPKSFPFRKINRVIRNISYNFAHRIVFQTEDQKNYFSPIVQKKGVIIRNPIRENMPKPFAEREITILLQAVGWIHRKICPCCLKAIRELQRNIRTMIYISMAKALVNRNFVSLLSRWG